MTDEQVAIKLTDHDVRLVGAEHRLKDLEEQQKTIQDIAVSTKELAIATNSIAEEQKVQGVRLKALEDKPAQMWSSMTKTIFTTIVSAIAGGCAVALANLLF